MTEPRNHRRNSYACLIGLAAAGLIAVTAVSGRASTDDFAALWEKAAANNSDLQAARLAVERARAMKENAGIIVPSNPELEISHVRGEKETSLVLEPGLQGPIQRSGQRLSGFEAGLSQELEIAGQRGLRLEIADLRLELARVTLQHRSGEIRALLRREYYAAAAAGSLQEHLTHHIATLRSLPPLRDAKMGTYVNTAVLADLSDLESERADAGIQSDRALGNLRLLCNDPSWDNEITAKVAALRLVTFVFPRPPEAGSLTERALAQNTQIRMISLRGRLAKSGATLAERSMLPNVTIFAVFGTETTGSGRLATGFVGPASERQQSVRFGLRMPLPIFQRNQNVRTEADFDDKNAELEAARLRREIEINLPVAVKAYARLYAQLESLRPLLVPSETSLARIDAALRGGRISYLEFWSEHERWHETEKRYLKVVMDLAGAWAEMETLSGTPFDGTVVR